MCTHGLRECAHACRFEQERYWAGIVGQRVGPVRKLCAAQIFCALPVCALCAVMVLLEVPQVHVRAGRDLRAVRICAAARTVGCEDEWGALALP